MWIEPFKSEYKSKLDGYLIHHRDGRTIEFSAAGYSKTTWDKVSGQMRELNKYLAWIEQKNPKRIDDIFNAYREAADVFFDTPEPQRQVELLSRAVKKIYAAVVYDEILSLCKVPGWVKLPPDLKNALVTGDTPEKTYLRAEYIELTALVVYFRLMAPIWGEFLKDANATYGVVRKDDVAMQLMSRTRLHEIPAYDRLEEYIDAQTEGSKRSSLAMSVDLMSAEKIPSWLRSQAIVRRLAMRDLDEVVQIQSIDGVSTSTTHIVTLIYNYIDNLCTDRRFNGPVTDKAPRYNSNGRDDDSQGVTDNITVKDRRSPRTLRLDIAYLNNIKKVVTDIDPTADNSTVVEVRDRIYKGYIDTLNRSSSPDLVSVAIRTVTQWIINEVVPARSIAAIPLAVQTKAFAVASVILDHWGFPELAALVAGQPKTRGDIYQYIEPITQSEIKAIEARYPHSIYYDERTHMVIAGITEVGRLFSVSDWDVKSAGPELCRKIGVGRSGTLLCPADIMHQLIAFVIHLNDHINSKTINKG